MQTKELVKSTIKFLLTPLRWNYRSRNGAASVARQRHEVPNDILLGMVREYICKGHTVTINVKGISMRPFIEEGRDKVVLGSFVHLNVGDAVLAEIEPGHYVLHRIVSIFGDKLVLMGDGNLCCTEQCSVNDVAGVIVSYIRPNRTIDATNKWFMLKIRVWKHLLPLRRYLLFIYRCML